MSRQETGKRIGIVLAAWAAAAALGATWLFRPAQATDFVQPEEMQRRDQWLHDRLLDATSTNLPFSFVYDGKASGELLSAWPKKVQTKKLDGDRTQRTSTWTDPKTGLEVRSVVVDYGDFPAVEWTVYFTNPGKEVSPLLENVQGLDARLERSAEGEFLLHHWKGDTSAPDLYQPLDLLLGPNVQQRFAPAGGRGSNGAFPYYNLALPGGGLMLAVGWPGQWATTFSRDAQRGLRITAGQELTHLGLPPGQQIRTPLVALLFWQGRDTVRAQNLWRRWMWAHNVPRTADGKLPPPILFGNTSGEFNEMCNANEENQKSFIDRYREEQVKIDYWWMDAGWYPCGGQWWNTGTWEPDPKRFPHGLRAISDHAHAQGVKTLVWFEPERVHGDTWLARNRRQWLLGGTLLDLGNPEAFHWLTDHTDGVLGQQGIDLYRQDFNMDPLALWRANDPPDRRGLTENLHVQNYLAYWDALRQRHPGADHRQLCLRRPPQRPGDHAPGDCLAPHGLQLREPDRQAGIPLQPVPVAPRFRLQYRALHSPSMPMPTAAGMP